jgi:hypothetical protein
MVQEYDNLDLNLDTIQTTPGVETFFVDCLAWGMLRAYGIKAPPVPVQEMVKHPIPVFEQLALLEMNLGLYKAAYRSCLDGSRLIVVDPTIPLDIQRESIARELYVAFCFSPQAPELFRRKQFRIYDELFAQCLLMPTTWVQEACSEAISMEGLTTRFGVSMRTMSHRLSKIYAPPKYGLGELLAQFLFALEEPWQGRFLDVVADMTSNEIKARQLLTQKEIASWLNSSPSLCQDVRYLLDAWRKPWNVCLTTNLAQGLPA